MQREKTGRLVATTFLQLLECESVQFANSFPKKILFVKSVDSEDSMWTIQKFILLAIVFAISMGCEKADPGPPNTMRAVLGALQIRDVEERDRALATACRESADHGAVPSVLMGLQRIESPALKDDVAEYCAIALNEHGESDGAEDVAKLISDESKRKKVLSKLSAENGS